MSGDTILLNNDLRFLAINAQEKNSDYICVINTNSDGKIPLDAQPDTFSNTLPTKAQF